MDWRLPDPEIHGHMSDTAKVVTWLLLGVAIVALLALGVPPVAAVVLGVCGGLLLNGAERAAGKHDLWPD
jgi:hypothetical protein